jgi:hypothetical protein
VKVFGGNRCGFVEQFDSNITVTGLDRDHFCSLKVWL